MDTEAELPTEAKRPEPTARCGWSGVGEKLSLPHWLENLAPLVDLLPSRKASKEILYSEFLEMGAAHLRDLCQDELGPSRADRARAVAIATEQLDCVISRLEELRPKSRALLAAELVAWRSPVTPNGIDPLKAHEADMKAIEALAIASRQLIDNPTQKTKVVGARAIINLCWAADKAFWLMSNLDTTTDGDLILPARPSLAKPLEDQPDRCAALGERLERLASRMRREMIRIQKIKGPDPRVSFDVLVARICDLWTRETGQRATSNPYEKTEYAVRSQRRGNLSAPSWKPYSRPRLGSTNTLTPPGNCALKL